MLIYGAQTLLKQSTAQWVNNEAHLLPLSIQLALVQHYLIIPKTNFEEAMAALRFKAILIVLACAGAALSSPVTIPNTVADQQSFICPAECKVVFVPRNAGAIRSMPLPLKRHPSGKELRCDW
jgi:hypothetical protein